MTTFPRLMRIYLQHKRTGDFVQTREAWTAIQDDGLDFGSYQSALDFARNNDMTDVQLVIVFLRNQQTIVLPLQN